MLLPRVADTMLRLADFGQLRHTASALLLCWVLWVVSLWGTVAWRWGIPTSESHALLSALAGTTFAVDRHGEHLIRVSLRDVGRHFAMDALAALTAACENGISPEAAAEGLARYAGADRRMEKKGVLPSGAEVYEDYAHHPTEIRAALAAARQMGYRRVVCVFQSHT